MKPLKAFLMLSALASFSLPYPAGWAAESGARPPLKPRIDTTAKIGSERNIGVIQGWAPLAQDPVEGRVLYNDTRLMQDNQGNKEGNIGFGYREMNTKLDAIIGAYAYFDRRSTDAGNNFSQITLGTEFMRADHDARLNVYLPITRKQRQTVEGVGQTAPYLANTGIFYDTTGKELVEEAQPGLDLELGWRVPVFEDSVDSIRVFGAGYAFFGDESEDVKGARARVQVDINSSFSVGARVQRDNVRGGQDFLELTYRFPAAKQSFRKHGLYARMDEAPERDVDIVSVAKEKNLGQKEIPVLNAETGAAQKVFYVDNTAGAGGTGSIENPYNTLLAAQSAAGAHDIIYVARGDGTTTGQDQGVTLAHEGMGLIGSGVDFRFDGSKFVAGGADYNGALLKAAAGNSYITNINAGGDGITVNNDDILIAGVTVENAARDGVSVNGNNFEIMNSTVSSNARHGIAAFNTDGFYIHDFTAMGNTEDNILVEADAGAASNVRIENVQLDGGANGVRLNAFNAGRISDVRIENSLVENATNSGVNIASTGLSSLIEDVVVDGNDFSGNQTWSIYSMADNNGNMSDMSVTNNIAETKGILFRTTNGSDLTGDLIIQGNEISNVAAGILVSTNGSASSINKATISDNIISVSDNAIFTSSYGTGTIDTLNINNNIISNAAVTAIRVATAEASSRINDVNVDGNTVSINDTGIYITAETNAVMGPVSISNSTFTGSTDAGITLAAYTGGDIASIDITNSVVRDGGAASTYGALTIIGTNTNSTVGNIRIENVTVTGNRRDGVYIREGGGFNNFIGLIDLGGGGLSAGNNSFYGNRLSNTGTYGDLRLWGGSFSATARNNWWGQAGGPGAGQVRAQSGGTASTTSPLASDPN